MNYGLFFHTTIADGTTIEIHRKGYTGTAKRIAAMAQTPYVFRVLDNDSAEVVEVAIVKTSVELNIINRGDFDYSTFFTSDATRWRVVLKRGSIVWWNGYITPESFNEDVAYNSTVRLTARDNLGVLEELDYDHFDSPFVTLEDIAFRAFEKIGGAYDQLYFDTGILSSFPEIRIEYTSLNTLSFKGKKWFEVLESVLRSFALRLSFDGGRNRWAIRNVGNDATGKPAYHTKHWGDVPNVEIMPTLREMTVIQDLQPIKEHIDYDAKKNTFVKKYDPEPYPNRYDTRYKIPELKCGAESDTESGQMLFLRPSDYSNVNDASAVMPNHTLLWLGSRDNPAYFYFSTAVVKGAYSLEYNIEVLNCPFVGAIQDGEKVLLPESVQNDKKMNVRFLVVLIVRGIEFYMINNGGWSTEKPDLIRSDIPMQAEARSSHKVTISVQGIPAFGELQLRVFNPDDIIVGGTGGKTEIAASGCIVFTKFSLKPIFEVTRLGKKLGIHKSARGTREIELLYGELPEGSENATYAGGVFNGSDQGYSAIRSFGRMDGIGGLMNLTELIARSYAHRYAGFTTDHGERTAGRVIRATINYDWGFFTDDNLEIGGHTYAISSMAISGGAFSRADLTLVQVKPYVHLSNDVVIENFVDAGGGSFVGGGGDTYVTHMTGGGGADLNGKRLFALDEAADDQIDDLYLLADKPGNTVAQKIRARAFARRTHAKQHFKGGADEIKPYDIDAAQRAGDSKQPFAAEDLTAQDITARNATVAEDVKATAVYASKKIISPFVSSPEFLAVMLGYGFGGYVDENGESHLWADHLHGRVSFETLEMRYRKLLVSGEDLLVSSGGVVEEVLSLGQSYLSTPNGRLAITQDGRRIIVPSNGRVVFKLKGEPGIDIQQFDTDDILRYTWRDTETGNDGASGWLRIKHSFDTFWYEAEVVSGSPEWLRKGMSLGQFGNYTKKYRQGFINISARDKQIAIWDDVDNHILAPSMLKAYLGDLRYVTDSDFPIMQGFGLYAQSCYLKGVFVLKSGKKVDEEFDRVETEFQIIDGKIESKVSKTTYEANNTTIREELSSQATQTAEGFKQTVRKTTYNPDETVAEEGDVISEVNQTKGRVKIKAENIEFEGAVTANKYFKILEDGSMDAVNGKFSGTIRSTDAEITGKVTMNEGRVNGYVFLGYEVPVGPGGNDVSHINQDQLTFYGNNRKTIATVGKNVFGAMGPYNVAGRFENHANDSVSGDAPNIGLFASASGAPYATGSGGGNHALQIGLGDVSRFSYYLKRLGNDYNGITLDPAVGYYSFARAC